MIRRLIKELSGLRPYWIGLLALELIGWFVIRYVGPLRLSAVDDPQAWGKVTGEQMSLAWRSFMNFYTGVAVVFAILQWIVFHLVSAGAFGWEFSEHTIDRLLAQPIARSRIWTDKILALILIMAAVLIGNTLLYLAMIHEIRYAVIVSISGTHDDIRNFWVVFTICSAALALANGPLMALLLRQTHTAFWGALVLPILVLTIFVYIDNMAILPFFGFSIADRLNAGFYKSLGEFNLMILFTIIWFPIPFFLGWRNLKRLEV